MLKIYLLKMHPILKNRFFRFLIIGGINTLFGYSIFALFIFIGLHYALASFLALLAGVLFNFKTTGRFVFQSKNNLLIFKFASIYLMIYLINVGFLKFMATLYINMYLAGALVVFPVAILSFTLQKKFVFRTENTK